MAIDIKNDQFIFAHGKAPKGFGQWAFILMDGTREGETIFVHPPMTLREASARVRKTIRHRNIQDATLQVAP